jgi:hypothetical protein
MCDLTRDEVDELNAQVCPLIYPTIDEANMMRELMRQMYPDRFVTNRLYHFTKPSVVRDCLFKDSGDLRCTHVNELNDDSEWRKGLDYIGDYLRNQGNDDFADEVDKLSEKMGCVPYVCSFSQYDDKASMWGMYGDRQCGGYALGFDRTELERLVNAKNVQTDDEYYLLPCLYSGVHDADVLLDHILNECHVDEDEHLIREGCENELPSRILSRIFFLSLIIKDSSFDYENEWRLVVRKNTAAPLQRGEGFFFGDTSKHVYSELFEGPLRNYFSRIVVSPCGGEDVRNNNYSKLLDLRTAHGLSFEVAKSRSPYNGR